MFLDMSHFVEGSDFDLRFPWDLEPFSCGPERGGGSLFLCHFVELLSPLGSSGPPHPRNPPAFSIRRVMPSAAFLVLFYWPSLIITVVLIPLLSRILKGE